MSEAEEEFREFAVAVQGHLRRSAYLLCGDWHLAEDIVQSAFVKMSVEQTAGPFDASGLILAIACGWGIPRRTVPGRRCPTVRSRSSIPRTTRP